MKNDWIKREVEVEVRVTAEEAGQMFVEADSDWQVKFLNTAGVACCDFWSLQCAYIGREIDPTLTPKARVLVQRLHEYIVEGKTSIPDAAVCFFKHGNQWCCVHGDFINLRESPAGFGITFDEALASLIEARKECAT